MRSLRPLPRLGFWTRLVLGPVLVCFVALGYGGCAAAQPRPSPPAPPAVDLPALEAGVLAELNRVRIRRGRAPLRPDSALAALARAHSADMVARRYFAHRSPGGAAVGDRARAAGYRFRALGENLYRGTLYDTVSTARRAGRTTTAYRWHEPEALAALVVSMWMGSPGHRDNMLSGRYDFGGVGIALGADAEVLVTLNLSAR